MSTPNDLSTDEQLGLDAPPPSPDAKNAVALKRFYAPLAVAIIGVALVLVFAKDLPPVPAYTATVTVDGAAPGAQAMTAASKLEVRLEPEGDPGGPVEAWVYVEQGGEVRRAMDAHPKVDGGVVRLSGEIGPTLGVTEGAAQVIVLVTRPGGFPETPSHALGDGPWYAARITLKL